MTNAISLKDCKSYATEANLDKGLAKLGLDNFIPSEGGVPMRYIKCCTEDGRWTAVFMVSACFAINRTGGYIGIASQHGFMSV